MFGLQVDEHDFAFIGQNLRRADVLAGHTDFRVITEKFSASAIRKYLDNPRLLLLTRRTMLARRKLLRRTSRHMMMPHMFSRLQLPRRGSYCR